MGEVFKIDLIEDTGPMVATHGLKVLFAKFETLSVQPAQICSIRYFVGRNVFAHYILTQRLLWSREHPVEALSKCMDIVTYREDACRLYVVATIDVFGIEMM